MWKDSINELINEEVVKDVINNYIESKCMIKENSYWGNDLQTLHACEESLKGVYGRLIDKGLTKNVYIVQQLGEIISKLEKLTK